MKFFSVIAVLAIIACAYSAPMEENDAHLLEEEVEYFPHEEYEVEQEDEQEVDQADLDENDIEYLNHLADYLENEEHDLEAEDEDEFEVVEAGSRQPRVTCDLLSIEISKLGKVNDAACAANCLTLGKAGGRCNKGVCQCRKTTIKDLWNRRFG